MSWEKKLVHFIYLPRFMTLGGGQFQPKGWPIRLFFSQPQAKFRIKLNAKSWIMMLLNK